MDDDWMDGWKSKNEPEDDAIRERVYIDRSVRRGKEKGAFEIFRGWYCKTKLSYFFFLFNLNNFFFLFFALFC